MEIKVSQNNYKLLAIEFTTGNLQPYNVPVGTTIKFSVKKSIADNDDKILISKTITGDGSPDYYIEFLPTDTNIPIGIYYWDLKNITDNITICEPDIFEIKGVVLQNE
ncbi:MAG: hypothetical protein IJS60_08760 [Abditibacteriota bacterium]|nr:hypothetical protein [Abditibacteriota bacterium]